MAFFLLKSPNSEPIRIELDRFPFSVGRDTNNSLILEDENISRKHFRIKKRGKIYIIEDLGSRNGTFVNGDRIINTKIQNNDSITIGSQKITFFGTHEDIHVSTEFANLDWESRFDQHSGIHRPIPLQEVNPTSEKLRYNINQLRATAVKDQIGTKTIFDIYSDIIIFEDLTESARVLLKSSQRISKALSQSSLFIWNAINRTILPIAHWHYTSNHPPFSIVERALKDAVTRKSPIKISVSEQNPEIIVMPMIHHEEILAVVHFEIRKGQSIAEHEVALLHLLLQSTAPLFETLLLRKEMDTWLVGMVETMIATVEAKDTYTRGHSERVCRYAMAIADELKIQKETKRMLMISSLCHDIGKIGIPDAILKKASILSTEEYQEIKLHPELGADIIQHMPGYQRFLSGVKYHHEKWDGTGYPEGLQGEDIPFFGRIVAIADVFDAMVSGRAYSGFMDQNEAVAKLEKESDLFDPQILSAFLNAYNSGRLTIKTTTASNRPGKVATKQDD